MESERISLNLFSGVMGFIILTELLGGWLIQEKRAPFLAVIGILRIIQTGGVLALVLKTGLGLKAIGLQRGRLLHGVYRGGIWSMGFGAVTLLGFGALALLGVNPLTLFHAGFLKNGQPIVSYLLVGVVIGPVAEEILFRGVVYGFLRKWGVVFALFSSTLLFAGLHGLASGAPLTQIAGGLLFAVSYEKEENLMSPIVIHVLGNGAIFTLSVLNRFMG